ncbi:hypothetical protein A6F68_02608 [Tsuneonella dongtanensis]|uniref:DUF1838 domain-containing protein n=1 Tax=Tsuneonella dongtanensis TaxID=692370 RepID=A0A1B2AG28_9SPHN|nr:DUF1838 family protein [Tsuneonella dongtanensis]ANY21102.1 hypothetical protein A6F68_02608 [Tsuneonella dongtanensis]
MSKAKFLAAVALGATLATPALARQLDPSVPADALEISKRVQCGEADGKPAVYHWQGNVYSRVAGEPDRLLFKGEGMNIRTCTTVEDPKRGKGWRLVSREIMLYLDPKTGEVLRKWDNPWTGETVDVMHIANDPVNQRPSFPINADGTPYANASLRREGRWFFMPFEVPLFYTNPLGGKYQDWTGGKYHAMEIFDFAFDADEMLDTKNKTAYPIVSWVRISDWMPWMKMRGRQGQMVFNAMGNKLTGYDELPAVLKDEIALNYPAYTTAPPVDDARPNETTWTVFMKWVDDKMPAAKPSGGH